MNLFHFFSLVNTQARMNLKAEASRFILSYLWWVIEPLLFVLIFYLVFDILLNNGRADFLLFLTCGKIPFLWFSKSVTSASNSIVQNKGLIHQIDMPKALFPYVSVHEALYKQWVVFLVLFGVVILYGYQPEPNWFWLIPVMFVQYGLILVCSLLGALCVSFVGDFRIIISMCMMFLMFSSGIFWDINAIANPVLRDLILTYNPIAFLIDAYRQVLMERSLYDLKHLATLGGVVLVALFSMHVVLHKASKIIASKVINS
jgi:lipopolysaccharide transport system permease protein